MHDGVLLSPSRFAIAQTLFLLWRAVLTTHFTRSDACQWCSGSVNHSPSSSVISPYSVYVVSEILCTVTGMGDIRGGKGRGGGQLPPLHIVSHGISDVSAGPVVRGYYTVLNTLKLKQKQLKDLANYLKVFLQR